MQQQLIVDADGVWYTNTAQFGFTDPSTKVRFNPGVQVKVKPSAWVKNQPTLKALEAEKPAEKPAEAPVKAPAAAPVAAAPAPKK